MLKYLLLNPYHMMSLEGEVTFLPLLLIIQFFFKTHILLKILQTRCIVVKLEESDSK